MATFVSGKNPANDYTVIAAPDGVGYVIGVNRYCECGAACCSHPIVEVTPHTNGRIFEDEDEAYDWIEAVKERFEEQYDEYLQENHDAIVQQERYEAFLAEQ